MSNWQKQITDHCETGALSWCTYYGERKNRSEDALQNYDVVITTVSYVALRRLNC